MKRITEISLCNYRAFLNKPGEEDKYKISLPKGENLLIYGENGSGKSSLFKGLRDVFYSANNPAIPVIQNIFAEPGDPETEVKIKISETQADGNWSLLHELTFKDGGSTTENNINLLNSTNAFLTYRDILKTYLYTNQNGNPNLFDFFILNLLGRITDGASNTLIREEIEKLENKIKLLPQAIIDICAMPDDENSGLTKQDTIGVTAISIEELEKLESDVVPLNNQIRDILNDLFTKVNIYLKYYFDSNISIDLKEPDKIIYSHGHNLDYSLKKELFLKISYFDKEIDAAIYDYPSFLNEARLSAIAICLYLASVKNESLRVADNLKILFLDDIFIGVDTSNRIPLLKILADDFKDFQIILSTYDREWFELAKNWIERKSSSKWLYYEFYADDYSYNDKEVPKIKLSKDHLSLATYYYKKSDYSASGNYLRKACEETLQKILPSFCLKGGDGMDMTKLSSMIDTAKSFFLILNQPTDDIDTLAVYLQALMNPLSHYYISASVFKKEIKEVEVAINNLLGLNFTSKQFKKILDKGTSIKLSYQVSAHKYNVYEIKIKKDLWIYKEKDLPDIYIGNVECENEDLYEIDNGEEGQKFHISILKKSLADFYIDAVTFENTKVPSPNISIIQDYAQLFEYKDETKNWKSLNSLLVF